MEKEKQKEINRPQKPYGMGLGPEQTILAKMEHVNQDGMQLYAYATSASDKGSSSNLTKFMEDKYKLSTQEFTNYIKEDLANGEGKAWNRFTEEYEEMLPEHRIHFKPAVITIGDYLTDDYKAGIPVAGKATPCVMPPENRNRAYQRYESIIVTDKGSDNEAGFLGGVAGVVGGIVGGVTATAGAAAFAGGVAAGAGAYAVGHYGGKMVAQHTVDRNNAYIEEQKRKVQELRNRRR